MSPLYNRIDELCKQRKISGARLCREIGIQPSILTDLKYGRQKGLSAVTAQKIAAFFSVSVAYLLGEENEKLAPEGKLINDDPELTAYVQDLKERPEIRMLFSLTHSATKEDVECAVKIIKALKEYGHSERNAAVFK